MKTIDFFCLSIHKNKATAVGLLCCFALTANAEPPPPEAFTQSNELVLTLSDEWLESATNTHHNLRKPKNAADASLINQGSKVKPANIGCGMDMNPIADSNVSLTGRVVGKCNFNYQY